MIMKNLPYESSLVEMNLELLFDSSYQYREEKNVDFINELVKRDDVVMVSSNIYKNNYSLYLMLDNGYGAKLLFNGTAKSFEITDVSYKVSISDSYVRSLTKFDLGYNMNKYNNKTIEAYKTNLTEALNNLLMFINEKDKEFNKNAKNLLKKGYLQDPKKLSKFIKINPIGLNVNSSQIFIERNGNEYSGSIKFYDEVYIADGISKSKKLFEYVIANKKVNLAEVYNSLTSVDKDYFIKELLNPLTVIIEDSKIEFKINEGGYEIECKNRFGYLDLFVNGKEYSYGSFTNMFTFDEFLEFRTILFNKMKEVIK